MERCTDPIRNLEHDLSAVPAIGDADNWEAVSVTLAEIMADSGHYSIDSASVRAHVSAMGEKGGLIEELLAAREAGSSLNLIAWRLAEDDRSPYT